MLEYASILDVESFGILFLEKNKFMFIGIDVKLIFRSSLYEITTSPQFYIVLHNVTVSETEVEFFSST